MSDIADDFDQFCQSCGACCAHSRDWPRFTTEHDQDIDDLPRHLVRADQTGMQCDGERCSALNGQVGVSTFCSVYDLRPDVCRTCQIGDPACQVARRGAGLKPVVVVA